MTPHVHQDSMQLSTTVVRLYALVQKKSKHYVKTRHHHLHSIQNLTVNCIALAESVNMLVSASLSCIYFFAVLLLYIITLCVSITGCTTALSGQCSIRKRNTRMLLMF